MIVLDTHIWIWWNHEPQRLSTKQAELIAENENNIIGVSAISCWEVCKLVEYRRLELPVPLAQWFASASLYPGIQILPLTPEVAIHSTQLPGTFHRDPADQIIVATARLHNCPLITSGTKLLSYPHVASVR